MHAGQCFPLEHILLKPHCLSCDAKNVGHFLPITAYAIFQKLMVPVHAHILTLYHKEGSFFCQSLDHGDPITLFSKRNARFLKLPFFWRRVHASESVVIPFHALFLIAWLADGDSLMCNIVTMGRQIAKMFSTFSLWGSLFLTKVMKTLRWGQWPRDTRKNGQITITFLFEKSVAWAPS